MVDFVADTSLPPPPPTRLERLQTTFENRFPKAYLDFMDRGNGAKLVNNEVASAVRPFVIERFLPIVADPKTDPSGWADVAVVTTQLDARLVSDENATGIDLIPIAAMFAGDFVVLDYRENRTEPSVGIWDHEVSDDFAPKVETIAPTFSAFLSMMR